MPIDGSGNFLAQTPNSIQSMNSDVQAPPLYGEHILDQPYTNIDQTIIRTPIIQSGISTPFYHYSRAGSVENLVSINDTIEDTVRPDALTSILQSLNISSIINGFPRSTNGSSSGMHTPYPEDHQYSPPLVNTGFFDTDRGSNPRVIALSRRTSEDAIGNTSSGMISGRHTPEHVDLSNLDLTKVPSYTTAVRTPVRGLNYSDAQALPNYDAAVSAPPSPERRIAQLAT
jgi:arrestin-related trafficking adapter 4/5/7